MDLESVPAKEGFESYFAYGSKVFWIVTVITIVVCVIIWRSVEKKINRYNRNHPGHEAPTRFVAAAVRFAFLIIGLLIVMTQVIPLKPIVDMIFSAGSVLAICCTFAARESFSNYISGFLLALHKPFKIGDMVYLQGGIVTGIVKEISFRHTVILSENGTIATIPNSVMNSLVIEVLPNGEKTGTGSQSALYGTEALHHSWDSDDLDD